MWLLVMLGLLQPTAEIQVTTFSGDVYVAGSGDDCRAAWVGVRFPEDWRKVECVPVVRW